MKKWWIGCSGFYYKGWKEKFYPAGLPQRKWFEYYCEFFNTVELNVTFYRLPKPETFKGWYERSPDEFRFAVKAPRLITHFRRFNDVHEQISSFYDLASTGLADKLGCILFQLHPRTIYSEENLEKIIHALDLSYTNVIEFRHVSWWRDDVLSTLKQHNITFCSISYPGLPDAVLKSAPALYYRFHGVPRLYLSSYSKNALQKVSDTVKGMTGIKDVYAYFNNDIEVAAISNAKTLQKLVSRNQKD